MGERKSRGLALWRDPTGGSWRGPGGVSLVQQDAWSSGATLAGVQRRGAFGRQDREPDGGSHRLAVKVPCYGFGPCDLSPVRGGREISSWLRVDG